jgi:hypothetical protein
VAPWTYPVVDARTGAQVVDHVPLKVDSFTDQLGVAVGSMTGSMSVGAGPVDVDEALMPDGIPCRVIVPCYLGQPRGAVLVTQLGQYGPRSAEVSFTAQRVDWLLARREVWSTLQFVQQDQLTIYRALVGYAIGLYPLTGVDPIYTALMAQLPPAAQLPWWTLDDSLSGVLRDRMDNDSGYQMQQHGRIADLLRNLSELDDRDDDGEPGPREARGLEGSFDVRLDYTRHAVTGALGVTVRLGYPRLGSTDPLPLEYPGNIIDWRYAVDASDAETMTRMFGAGSGIERRMGPIQTDYTAHDRGWPLLMGSGSSTASEIDTLAEQGRSRLGKMAGANEGWAVTVSQTMLGQYELGDTAQLRIRDRRWSQLKVTDVRIVGHKVTPSRQGVAGRVELVVVPL